MLRSRPFLALLSLLAIPSLPLAARAQVKLPQHVNPVTSTLIEEPYAVRYENYLRDRQRREQLESSGVQERMREREAEYARDACGLGCSGHEGLQVRGIPGTRIAAVIYKVEIDDGVLTLRLRFINDGRDPARLVIDPRRAPEWFYVQVGEEKLHILRDEAGELEAKEPLDEVLEPGEIESWWAEFPAPAPGTDTFDFWTPDVGFLDIPLENE